MNNNVKSPYFNMYKYWLHSWDFWPAYPAETRYFATSEIKLIFMFWNIQMKMALQNKMIFETECHHWKLLLGSSWCACVHTHITFTHTHSWLYITLGITHFTLCPVSNIPEETMFQILLAGMRMERHLLSCLKLNVTTENRYLTAVGVRACTHTFMFVHHTWHYSIYTLSSVQYSKRNNVSNSACRYENGEAPAKLCVTEEAHHTTVHPTPHILHLHTHLWS